MKHPMMVVFALILFSSVANAADGELPYTFPEPEGWEVKKGMMGTDIVVLSAMEGPDDTFRENVNVVSEKAAFVGSLKKYVDLNVDSLSKMVTDFELVKREEIKVNGEVGERLEYKMKSGVYNLHNELYVFYKGGTGYNVTMSMLVGESREKWLDKLVVLAEGFKFK